MSNWEILSTARKQIVRDRIAMHVNSSDWYGICIINSIGRYFDEVKDTSAGSSVESFLIWQFKQSLQEGEPR